MTISAKYPWEYIKSLDADDFCDILLKGKEAKDMDRFFFRWCLLEVHNYGEPISFKDYVDSFRRQKPKSTKEILQESNEIINLFNKGFERADF